MKSNATTLADTSVYRYYDIHGLLIYVGITSRGITRNREHNTSKVWWPFVDHQEVEHFPTRAGALRSESALIRGHRPPFNTQQNPGYLATRATYLAFANAPVRELTDNEKVALRHRLPLVAIKPAAGDVGMRLRSLPEHHEIIRELMSDEPTRFPDPPRVSTMRYGRAGRVTGIEFLGSTLVVNMEGKYLPCEITSAVAFLKTIRQKPVALRIEKIHMDDRQAA